MELAWTATLSFAVGFSLLVSVALVEHRFGSSCASGSILLGYGLHVVAIICGGMSKTEPLGALIFILGIASLLWSAVIYAVYLAISC